MDKDNAIEKMQQEYIKKMGNINSEESDIEYFHIHADNVLIEFLRANGFDLLADHYKKQSREFWYA
jgi:hypothetical protein